MAKRVQIPVVGGLRKSVIVDASGNAFSGTTIQGFENQLVTLAQLKFALGLTSTPNTISGGGNGVSIVVGPGLSGGGSVGIVPINLTAPIPWMMSDGDGGGDGDPGPPGLAGANGTTGAPGPAGAAIFMSANDGEDGLNAIPGSPGPTGSPGSAGVAGPPGVAIFLTTDSEEGERGPPGPAGPPGTGGGTTVAANITPDTHPTTELPSNDEFEVGTSIDLTGSRFAGATAWAWVNQGTSTANLNSGSLILLPQVSVNNSQRLVIMPVSGTTWEYAFKIAVDNLVANAQSGGFGFYNSTSTKLTACGVFVSGTAAGNTLVQRWSTPTTSPSTVGTGQFNPAASAQAISGTTTSNILQCYMKAGFDGTNLYWQYSPDGIVFQTVYTETPAAFLTTCTHIALGGDNNGSSGGTTAIQAAYIYDWFRKTI